VAISGYSVKSAAITTGSGNATVSLSGTNLTVGGVIGDVTVTVTYTANTKYDLTSQTAAASGNFTITTTDSSALKIDDTNAHDLQPGTEVTIAPAKGYKLTKVEVGGTDYVGQVEDDGTYTFVMPAADTTVNVAVSPLSTKRQLTALTVKGVAVGSFTEPSGTSGTGTVTLTYTQASDTSTPIYSGIVHTGAEITSVTYADGTEIADNDTSALVGTTQHLKVTVTAESGASRVYDITVTIAAASSGKNLTAVKTAGDIEVENTGHTIKLDPAKWSEGVSTTDALLAKLSVDSSNSNAKFDVKSGTDSNGKVITGTKITVTAEDGSTQDYTVSFGAVSAP
jgi:hypothetical protein